MKVRTGLVVVAALMGLAESRPARAQSNLFEPNHYPVGDHPVGIVTGYFDTDAWPDLAVVNTHDDDITMLYGQSDGSFVRGANDLPVGDAPPRIATGDFDNDGWPDLAVTNQDSNSISVLLNDPCAPGTFLPKQDFAVGYKPHGITTCDLNNDDLPDLAVTNFGDGATDDDDITVLLNDPNAPGTFPDCANYPVRDRPEGIACGDFNGDDLPDLAVVNQYSHNISVLLNDPNAPGTFLPEQVYGVGPSPCYPIGIAVGDFDRDGLLDLAVAKHSTTSQGVAVLYGQPGGAFGSPNHYDAGTRPHDVVAVDLNGDGLLDLAVTDSDPPTSGVDLLFGKPNGEFEATPYHAAAAGNAGGIVTGHLNSGNLIDVAVACHVGDSVTVLYKALAALTVREINDPWGDVDLDPAPNASVPPSDWYALGLPVTLTAAPIEGKFLKHWILYDPNHPSDANYAAYDPNNPVTVTMNGDREATAEFISGYALTVHTVEGGWGSVVVEPNLPYYLPDSNVVLYAEPNQCRSFSYWQTYDPNHPGDANYVDPNHNDPNNPLALVMDRDREVAAVFAWPNYVLSYDIVNSPWGSVDVDPWAPGYEYQACSEVTLNAVPLQGKSLKYWIVYDPNFPGDANHAVFDSNVSTTIVMMADREVTAVFKCGSNVGALLPLMVGLLGLFVLLRRRG